MEVYVYADEVDVRLHEGSFLLNVNLNILEEFFNKNKHKFKEKDFEDWKDNINRDYLIGFFDFAQEKNAINSSHYV